LQSHLPTVTLPTFDFFCLGASDIFDGGEWSLPANAAAGTPRKRDVTESHR